MDTITNRSTMFSSREACDLADISYRQLDYWCRIGTIASECEGKGSGSRRRWNVQQVAVLAVLGLVGGHLRVSDLAELVAVLLDWDVATWNDTSLLVAQGGVWLADAEGAPAVATAINLLAVRRQLNERAAAVDAAA